MPDPGEQYSRVAGIIYVFNLIVGTGALTMPLAFQGSGWLLSLITITLLCFMSFLTVSFVLETMSIANARLRKPRDPDFTSSINSLDSNHTIQDEDSETTHLLEEQVVDDSSTTDPFEITVKTEMGKMASMFFNKIGVNLFYICMVVYLYGDLSIYAATVPKSILSVACTYELNLTVNGTKICNISLTNDDLCWNGSNMTRMDVYRIFVAVFVLFLGPFSFFNLSKTKYLQYATTFFRWFAFGLMIVLTLIRLGKAEGEGHPNVANFAGIPNLFGVCVYSFMCHHSLPSLITPIKNKSRLLSILACDYALILGFYALLSFTGIYTFSKLEDIYTLNFLPNDCDPKESITKIKFFQFFLALFPVFTLSTNFPIISITLRENLKTLFYKGRKFPWTVEKLLFPIAAILPPIAVAFGTDQVEFLVGITGSYAGTAIQYVVPAALVYCARKDILSEELQQENRHSSPFRHYIWVIFVCVWSALCVILVTINHIIAK